MPSPKTNCWVPALLSSQPFPVNRSIPIASVQEPQAALLAPACISRETWTAAMTTVPYVHGETNLLEDGHNTAVQGSILTINSEK